MASDTKWPIRQRVGSPALWAILDAPPQSYSLPPPRIVGCLYRRPDGSSLYRRSDGGVYIRPVDESLLHTDSEADTILANDNDAMQWSDGCSSEVG